MRSVKNVLANIKSYKAHSIFIKTFFVDLIFILFPFIIMSTMYYGNIKNTAQSNIVSGSRFAIDEVSDITDSIMAECDRMCTYIANTDSVQMFMLNKWFFEMNNNTLGEVDQFINGLPSVYSYIDSVYIYSEFNDTVYNGSRWSSSQSFGDVLWMEEYKTINSVKGAVIPRAKNGNYPYFITIIKPIITDGEKKGAIVFNINSLKLYKMVASNEYTKEKKLYMTDERGKVLMVEEGKLFGTDMGDIYEKTASPFEFDIYNDKNGNRYYLSNAESGYYDVKYISASPMEGYLKEMSRIRLQIAVLLSAMLLLCIIFAFIVSVIIYSPVDEILSVIEDPKAFVPDETAQNELKYIVSNIVTHIRANDEMKKELEYRLSIIDQSQVRMLQSQINPHFLYNTLETINWMARELGGSKNKVSSAVGSLARLLRTLANNNEYIWSVADEIGYTRSYLDILKLRFEDMYAVVWEMDDGIEEYSIVKVCLQPVVENAVNHGLKPKGGEGSLVIRGRIYGEYLLFEVEDNGVGMSKEMLDELNERLHDREYVSGEHIGLYNVNHRIRTIFGAEYGLHAVSEEGKGTCVRITIPKNKINKASE